MQLDKGTLIAAHYFSQSEYSEKAQVDNADGWTTKRFLSYLLFTSSFLAPLI